jgi:hypothetical protein
MAFQKDDRPRLRETEHVQDILEKGWGERGVLDSIDINNSRYEISEDKKIEITFKVDSRKGWTENFSQALFETGFQSLKGPQQQLVLNVWLMVAERGVSLERDQTGSDWTFDFSKTPPTFKFEIRGKSLDGALEGNLTWEDREEIMAETKDTLGTLATTTELQQDPMHRPSSSEPTVPEAYAAGGTLRALFETIEPELAEYSARKAYLESDETNVEDHRNGINKYLRELYDEATYETHKIDPDTGKGYRGTSQQNNAWSAYLHSSLERVETAPVKESQQEGFQADEIEIGQVAVPEEKPDIGWGLPDLESPGGNATQTDSESFEIEPTDPDEIAELPEIDAAPRSLSRQEIRLAVIESFEREFGEDIHEHVEIITQPSDREGMIDIILIDNDGNQYAKGSLIGVDYDPELKRETLINGAAQDKGTRKFIEAAKERDATRVETEEALPTHEVEYEGPRVGEIEIGDVVATAEKPDIGGNLPDLEFPGGTATQADSEPFDIELTDPDELAKLPQFEEVEESVEPPVDEQPEAAPQAAEAETEVAEEGERLSAEEAERLKEEYYKDFEATLMLQLTTSGAFKDVLKGASITDYIDVNIRGNNASLYYHSDHKKDVFQTSLQVDFTNRVTQETVTVRDIQEYPLSLDKNEVTHLFAERLAGAKRYRADKKFIKRAIRQGRRAETKESKAAYKESLAEQAAVEAALRPDDPPPAEAFVEKEPRLEKEARQAAEVAIRDGREALFLAADYDAVEDHLATVKLLLPDFEGGFNIEENKRVIESYERLEGMLTRAREVKAQEEMDAGEIDKGGVDISHGPVEVDVPDPELGAEQGDLPIGEGYEGLAGPDLGPDYTGGKPIDLPSPTNLEDLTSLPQFDEPSLIDADPSDIDSLPQRENASESEEVLADELVGTPMTASQAAESGLIVEVDGGGYEPAPGYVWDEDHFGWNPSNDSYVFGRISPSPL